MRRILAIILGKTKPAQSLVPREAVRRLTSAKQDARTTQLRKELLTREVAATLGRLQR